MNILTQIAILFAVCLASQLIAGLLPFAFPATVLGMVLLLVLLCTRLIRAETIRPCSDFLLAHMAVLFVPSGVNVLNHWDIFSASWMPILLVCLGTVPLVYLATAWSVKLCIRLMRKKEAPHA